MTGWKRHECVGQGDCGYLGVAKGIHLNKRAQFLDAEAVQRNASNLRENVLNTFANRRTSLGTADSFVLQGKSLTHLTHGFTPLHRKELGLIECIFN